MGRGGGRGGVRGWRVNPVGAPGSLATAAGISSCWSSLFSARRAQPCRVDALSCRLSDDITSGAHARTGDARAYVDMSQVAAVPSSAGANVSMIGSNGFPGS